MALGPIQQAIQQQALSQSLQPSAQAPSATPSPNPQGQQGVGMAPYAALFGGQGADALSTIMALRNPAFKEANPMGEGGTLAAKAGSTLAFALLMHYLAGKGHPGAAKAIGYIGGASGAIPAALNFSKIAGQ